MGSAAPVRGGWVIDMLRLKKITIDADAGLDRRRQRLARQPVAAHDAADVALAVGQGEQGADQQAALQPTVGDQLLALFGADHLHWQVDRRMTLYAQQQAVWAFAQARQVEQKLWIGLATFGEWTFCAAVQRAE
mgnify:CR=1 FL=1